MYPEPAGACVPELFSIWKDMLPWYKQHNGCFKILIWRAGTVLWINSGKENERQKRPLEPVRVKSGMDFELLEIILMNGFVYGKWLFQNVVCTKPMFWNLRQIYWFDLKWNHQLGECQTQFGLIVKFSIIRNNETQYMEQYVKQRIL